MIKQISLDTWQVGRLSDLLHRGSEAVARTQEPIVLYRQMIEEEENSYEEMACLLAHGYVIEQVIVSGGVLPPSFGEIRVHLLNEYPNVLLRKSRERVLDVIDMLEGMEFE